MNKVGVVILNWNGRKHLQTYLPSVIKYSEGAEIIVVDNNSTDDSVEFVSNEYPQIKLVHNLKNGGFAKGYNDGLAKIEGDYDFYILLNSDVQVTKNWIKPIIEMMEKDSEIAACQPKILDYKKQTHFEHAGACGGFLDKNGYPFCRGRIFNIIEEDKQQYDTVREVFWATGACMFVKSKIFHEMGGFDEDYFAHMEEIDLCWRIKLHGKKIMVNPVSIVYHLGGGTLDYMSPRKVFLNFRNSLFTLYKNYRGNYLVPKIAWRFCLDYLAFIVFIVNGERKSSIQILKAQAQFISKLGEMRKKRRELIFSSKNFTFNNTGTYTKSIVFSFFIKKRDSFSKLDKNNIN